MTYSSDSGGQKERVLCEDGSFTLYSKRFDEPYHSTKDGALHESLQKHVLPALSRKKTYEKLTILDICFGLGYNTFATIATVLKMGTGVKIHIIAPEFDEALLRSLAHFDYPSEFEPIAAIIKSVSETLYYEDDQFKIEILLGDARESIDEVKERIDVIYQDAFSPAHNPLLWTREWFAQVRALCRDDAVLTTYSTAAAVRLGLYENGFYLFVHRAKMMRYSTVASLVMLENLEYIDMELKKLRNTEARSLRDEDFGLT